MVTHSKRETFIKLGICLLVAILLWPMASWFDMESKGWHIFSVFLAVILSFILRPYRMGMSVMIGLMVLVTTGTISMKESLSGFGDSTVWLVIAAFLLAGAVLNTGFGSRVALLLVVKLGKSMQGLAYAICSSEFLLGSVIPSNTARGGGLHAPIVDSLARSLEVGASEPTQAGRYLSLVGSHANLIVASMFMTGMAANPLVTKAAKDVFDLDFGWGIWLLGSIVPGILSLLILPQVLYLLAPPSLSSSKAARDLAAQRLRDRGPMGWKEKTMLAVLAMMLLLWSTQFIHGLSTTLVAWIGVIVLLLTNAQNWDDIISNDKAWDTLIWLGGLLTMANMLADYGFIAWFVETVKDATSNAVGLWIIISLGLFYFYSMYAFSMLTAHIAAMVVPFLSVCAATSAPPMISVAVFAYFSCLCGCTTNYSSGPVIIYFGLGYEKASRWFKIGFLISLIHIVVWLGSGLVWWRILGWW